MNSENVNSSEVSFDPETGTVFMHSENNSLVDTDITVNLQCQSEVSGSEVSQELTISVREARAGEQRELMA